jgi:hypothetical protein
VIQLKRFSSAGKYNYRSKIDEYIDAPIHLDVQILLNDPNRPSQIYTLFGVSNHFGGLGGGHCNTGIKIDTAYVQDPIDNRWYDCDDSRISPIDASNVITNAAYLLFYRRKDHSPDNFMQVLKESVSHINTPKNEVEVDQWTVDHNSQTTSFEELDTSTSGNIFSPFESDTSKSEQDPLNSKQPFHLDVNEEAISEWPPKKDDDDWSVV